MFNTLDSEYLTIWQQLENGYWVLVRTYSKHYAKDLVMKGNTNKDYGFENRYYACFPKGVNPNNIT